MEKTWKPIAAGVLAIVGGSLNILVALTLAMFMPIAAPFQMAFASVGFVGALFFGTGVVALIGGITALRRKRWALALAGSICAITPPSFLLGILSTVFAAMSREEFEDSTGDEALVRRTGEESTAPPCKPELSAPSEGERNA